MSEWISVENKLPEKTRWVLVHTPLGFLCVGAITISGAWWSVWGNSKIHVTHWQPLPEPPIDKEQTEHL
jgi:hypothetical protein